MIKIIMISGGELYFIESILDKFFSQGAALDRIEVLNFFNLRVSANWKIEDRRLKCFLFSVISGGRGHLVIDGREYSLGRGSSYLISPGMEHSISTFAESPLEVHSLHFSIADVVIKPYFLFKVLLLKEIEQFIEVLKSCSAANCLPIDKFHSYTLKYSVLRILMMYRDSLLNPPKGERDFISRINDLDSSFDLSVKELADVCGYSEKAFIRTFRRMYGTTPHQYMIKNKILRAEYFLLYSDLSIKEIASCLGYKDQYIFSKQFKKQTGNSPRRYREKYY